MAAHVCPLCNVLYETLQSRGVRQAGQLKKYSGVKKNFTLEKQVPPELADKLEFLVIYTLGLSK